MNPNAQFERDLEQWLETEAPASAPAGFHALVIDRARTLRQRPGWATSLPVRRFGRARGRGMTLLAAAALLLVGGALAAGSGFLRLPSIVPPLPAPSFVVVATASPSPSPSESAAPSASPIPVADPGGVWIPTGSMTTPRANLAAVRLLDGRVLVIGGGNNDENDTSSELYDPNTGTWSATGNMLRPRAGFPATLLRDGTVLVGDADSDERQGSELFDPVSGTWSATGKMVTCCGSTATLLRDGKVLVIGYDDTGELYDPVSGTWSATGKMTTPRHSHTALLLPDGTVLVAGGHAPGDEPTDAAELYDPDTGSWTAIENMHAERDAIAAFVLPNGQALVEGSSRGEPWSAELYDPATGAWTELAKPTEFGSPKALLSDGTILMTDRRDPSAEPDSPPPPCTAAALYDPNTASWTPASSMPRCGYGSFTLLLDGTVLVAGGSDCNDDNVCVPTGAAVLYVPAGVSLPPLPAFPSPPPPVFPSPTPRPTPLPPAAGPVPPNARSWKVTVDNKSSEPATLFVAEEDGGTLRLVGSATPNVVPADASVKVTFLFPAKAAGDGWIYVNPRPGEGGSLVHAADIGIPGKIVITADDQVGWLSP
jgi:hypothetical protein